VGIEEAAADEHVGLALHEPEELDQHHRSAVTGHPSRPLEAEDGEHPQSRSQDEADRLAVP
jgi:hypothetical protein